MTHLMVEIVVVWLVVILMGFPLFASMGLAAFAFVILSGLSGAIVPQKMAQAMNSFPIVAAPLFILMGSILGASQLTDRIVRFATSLVGSLRGGYAHASILSSMIFAGMVGSAVADAAGTGAVEVRAMKKAGYRPETAAAISSAAATIGPIIPPSLPMVIYGVSADASIGRLFLAGVIPGVLMGVSLMIMVAIIAPRQGLPRHAFGGPRRRLAGVQGRRLGADDAGHPAGRHVQRHGSRPPRPPPSPTSTRCSWASSSTARCASRTCRRS